RINMGSAEPWWPLEVFSIRGWKIRIRENLGSILGNLVRSFTNACRLVQTQLSTGAGDSLFGTFRLSSLNSLRGRILLRGLRIPGFLLLGPAIAYQRIISGRTLTRSLL